MKPKNETIVYVAMSGGVDSSVVATMLKEEGYQVKGIFMKNWSTEYGIENDCPWQKDIADVEAVCNHIGIPWGVYNFEKEYRQRILKYFFLEYKNGRTPNPDVLCNNLIKFDLFWKKAHTEGADLMATGHYARVNNQTGQLITALDTNKDQTYFLHRLSKNQLTRSIFPLGNLLKSEVRILAKKYNLPNADKKDSQGICFIGEINFKQFLQNKLGVKRGKIIDKKTQQVVGEHSGTWFYTIGQRSGLGIGGKDPAYYVVGKNLSANIIEVAQGINNKWLYTTKVYLEKIHLINKLALKNFINKQIWVSLRYRQDPQPAILCYEKCLEEKESLKYYLKFPVNKPAWAAAAGQSVVFYKNKIIKDKNFRQKAVEVLGGGIIS